MSDECLTLDTKEKYCADENSNLVLYVNGEVRDQISDYTIEDEDQVLLYYGKRTSQDLTDYFDLITDEACIYSGTCPERGTPPPEACGLTCEVSAEELYGE